jgi:hypothetical protein
MLSLCLLAAHIDPSRRTEYQQELARGDTALQERDYATAKTHYARANDWLLGIRSMHCAGWPGPAFVPTT